MGLSIMSALMIQNNGVRVGTYSNEGKTGYGFIVYLQKEGFDHTKIVSTLPEAPYATRKEAKIMGEGIVKIAKDLDLNLQKSGLEKSLGQETAEIVSDIVDEARATKSNSKHL